MFEDMSFEEQEGLSYMSSEDSELPKNDFSFARVFRGVSYYL
jgi:hypothetical protein